MQHRVGIGFTLPTMTQRQILALVAAGALTAVGLDAQTSRPATAPPEVKAGSISCEECPYPYPSRYLPLTLYTQDVRMAYMDVAPEGQGNGHTVVLLHGNNFAGFYWGGVIDVLRKEGFRIVVPDQIGYGRSSKPAIPYNLSDMARNTRRLLETLGIAKVMVVGHSMGGMAAARFATQYPSMVERLVLYNPIGVVDGRFARPAPDVDESYRQNLKATYDSVKASLLRYVAHDESVWNDTFEAYARIRYSWTLGAEWPRLALAQALIGQMLYQDQVVDDWAHIQAPTLAFGGAEDVLPGSARLFQERMKFIADAIPNGRGRLHLIPGLGHVPHIEAPGKTYPPLVAFLKEGLGRP